MNYLLVEDNKINLFILKKLLSSYCPNINMEEACNGEEAVEKVSVMEFDVILMDVDMPIMNGIEATSIIRKLGIKQPKIIGLTACSDYYTKNECRKAGMDNIIVKPLRKKDINLILDLK